MKIGDLVGVINDHVRVFDTWEMLRWEFYVDENDLCLIIEEGRRIEGGYSQGQHAVMKVIMSQIVTARGQYPFFLFFRKVEI